MPQPTRTQLVLVEFALGIAAGGFALHGVWRIAGAVVGLALLLFSLLPNRRRWLYQVSLSRLSMLGRRRRGRRVPGLAGVVGEFRVESAAGGSSGGDIGVVQSGTTWCVPLMLGLDGVFNDDPAVPLRALTGLLRIEDIALSSVRLVTVSAPAQAPANAPGGPGAPLPALTARYCLLTIDTRRAAEAIAARGGTRAAVHQILRRCAAQAQQELAGAGLHVRRLDRVAVESLFATWMGPASASSRGADRGAEAWSEVRVAGTWSTTFAVEGDGADLPDRVARLAQSAPTPVVTTSLVLRPADTDADEAECVLLIRLSSPENRPHEDAARSLDLLAQAYDLRLQRLDGEQGALLRATSPVGVGEPV